jgi:AcrR family transcriptional regulator
MEFNDKQLAIINSAEKLFSENGFDGTSVRDIAQAAGVNVAMISYYFGSKEKLMEALFEKKTMQMNLKVETMLQDESKTSLENVYTLIDDYIDKIINNPKFHKIMTQEQLVDKSSGIPTMINSLKKRNLDTIKRLIQSGQKTGAFRKNIDVPLMMCTMVGTVSQIIISNEFYREIFNQKDATDEEYKKYIRRKLSIHLKYLFKEILTNEKS